MRQVLYPVRKQVRLSVSDVEVKIPELKEYINCRNDSQLIRYALDRLYRDYRSELESLGVPADESRLYYN